MWTTCTLWCCRFYRLRCLHTSSDPTLDMWCRWWLQSRWVLESLLCPPKINTKLFISTVKFYFLFPLQSWWKKSLSKEYRDVLKDLPRVRVVRAWKPSARDLSCGLMHLHAEWLKIFVGNSSRHLFCLSVCVCLSIHQYLTSTNISIVVSIQWVNVLFLVWTVPLIWIIYNTNKVLSKRK